MKRIIENVKAWKIFNTGIIKHIKDFIYFKIISPSKEGKTDKYRKEIMDIIYSTFKDRKWMLSCGSFLRFYRDNTMKKQDLDILVVEKDFNDVKERLIELGFRIKGCFYNNKGEITEYKYIYKKVEIDFFIVRQNEEGKFYIESTLEDIGNNLKIDKIVGDNYITVTGKDYKTWKRYISNFDDIKTYEFEGFKFYGPKNPEKSLTELYGYNWRVYDPNYDSRLAPENNMAIPSENAKAIIYLEGQKKEYKI